MNIPRVEKGAGFQTGGDEGHGVDLQAEKRTVIFFALSSDFTSVLIFKFAPNILSYFPTTGPNVFLLYKNFFLPSAHSKYIIPLLFSSTKPRMKPSSG